MSNEELEKARANIEEIARRIGKVYEERKNRREEQDKREHN
jgi:hypothetical protein